MWRSVSVRVLIVDDSSVMRTILEDALRQADPELADTLQAATGVEALAALDRFQTGDRPLDLILCDLHMPKMSGLDFLREKRRRNLVSSVPVVMMTADDGAPEVLEALSAGALGYLSKPFTQGQIQSCVASLLPANSASPSRKGMYDNGR